ncbi:LysR family transcriptional regulator [Klebsiella sp. MISC125]|uniref:LysR family transcriptional regulator n=1 Tax=Klebsiella sp. MISC125 TaxID=2755386 RepID=UPI003DA855D2
MNDYLSDMSLFVEVVKARGFRRAAEITGTPASTLSRRISELEKSTGLRLLHRTTRKIELTDAGQIYFERCRRIVDEARLAHEQLGEIMTQPEGVLRASFPVDFAVTWLAPIIAEFAGLYPGITFEFDVTPRKVDLISEPSDVAIRIGEPKDSLLIARKLMSMKAYLYASPGYLARAGLPATPADLAHHACLGMLKNNAWTLHHQQQSETVAVSGRFTLNSVGMIRRLATLNMGIILMPVEVVADEVAAGKLTAILPQWHGSPQSVYAMTETRLLPARTQIFIEFLRERLASAE